MRKRSARGQEIEDHLSDYRSNLPEEHLAFMKAPVFENPEDEREHRKKKLAVALRLFAQFGFSDGVAGHITARDPIHTDFFWANPLGKNFALIKVSDLLLVSDAGEVVEGDLPVNPAAFAIHSRIHRARPDINAVAHAHSTYGMAWSSLGRLLDPITQDACAFYEDHVVFENYGGPAVTIDEGDEIASRLGDGKAIILKNHGLLTVGDTVDACAWWYISMERCCQVQLSAEAGGSPSVLQHDIATATYDIQGTPDIGRFNFLPLWERIVTEQPDCLS